MANIIKRTKLDPKKRFNLEHNNGRGFVSKTSPVSHSLKDADAKTFTGGYLNDTCFDWQYTHKAVETAVNKSLLKPTKRNK